MIPDFCFKICLKIKLLPPLLGKLKTTIKKGFMTFRKITVLRTGSD